MPSINTQFKKGHKSWLGKHLSPAHKLKLRLAKLGKILSTEHKKKISESGKARNYRGEKVYNWKGDKVGYKGLHHWVNRELGKPSKCEHCNVIEGRFEWANKSHEYKWDLEDWIRLCKKCHEKYDHQ